MSDVIIEDVRKEPKTNRLHEILDFSEKVMGKIGYIPFVGIIAGVVRAALGKLQIVCAIIVASVSGIFYLLERQDRWIISFKLGLLHIGHGLLNLGRAIFESIPFLALVTTLPYDLMGIKVLRYDNKSITR